MTKLVKALPGLRSALLVAFLTEARTHGNRVLMAVDAQNFHTPELQNQIKDGFIMLSVGPAAVPHFTVQGNELLLPMRVGGKPIEAFVVMDDVISVSLMADNNQDALATFGATHEHVLQFAMGNINVWDDNPGPVEPARKRPALSLVKNDEPA